MDLQTLMGDAYKEGLTVDEINTFLSDKKFADLSTGNYVDKNKYEADVKSKDAEIKQYKDTLKSKMTDAEKSQASEKEKDALIAELKQKIVESNVQNSKSSAESVLAETKKLLDIKDDDNSYLTFISSISTDNLESTKTLAKYINKMVQDSYEKGKKDATKDSLGKFSKGVGTSATKGTLDEAYGKTLAKSHHQEQVDSELYFKNK